MEKLFTDIDYTNRAIEANTQGKFLYIYVHDVEYEAEVLEWNYIEVQEERQKIDPETGLPMYDEEGNPIMETVTVQKAVPKMVEETYIDPETGETKTRIVQAHHTETFTKEVAELLIDEEFKYVIYDGNYTRCEDNPDYNTLVREKIGKLHMTPLDFIKCLEEKGVSYATIVALCNQNAEVDKQLRFCNHVFRGNALLDQLASQFGITSAELDEMFKNNQSEVEKETEGIS